MRVLHLSYFDNEGGAAKATNKLHKVLIKNGVDSLMLVLDKKTDDESVLKFNPSFSRMIPYLDSVPLHFYPNRERAVWGNGWISNGIINKINKLRPDIIQLNWVSLGMISIREIGKIKKPIVWRLSDSWPFTGGCHIPYDCLRYVDNCGQCPLLRSKKLKDITYRTLSRKLKFWNDLNLTIVAPSNWIANCAKRSSVFSKYSVRIIPTGVNVDIFNPVDKLKARQVLNISLDKKVILFGAFSATSDRNKGFEYLRSALSRFSGNVNEYEFIVLGDTKPIYFNEMTMSTRFVGKVSDMNTLVYYYSASDVFVLPSLLENLSNSLIESCSCGTPVVAFDTGGNSDIIDHKINGYLAKPFDDQDLFEGIKWILESKSRYKLLSCAARNKIIENFDLDIIYKKYQELYKSLL